MWFAPSPSLKPESREWCTNCGIHAANGPLCPVCLDDAARALEVAK